MHLAILQPVAGDRARRTPYRDEVALLGAVLARQRYRVTLTIVDTFDERALAAVLGDVHPALFLVYVDSLAADLAFRVAGALASIRGAPLVPFGPHAALCPDECLSMTGAEAVAVAPADRAIPAYVAARRDGLDSPRTLGLWVKCETGVMRNPPPPPPASLQDQPVPAREMYTGEQVVDPAGFVEVHAARGGEGGRTPGAEPPAPGAWPGAAPWPVLHRPVDAVIQEMRQAAETQIDTGGFRIGNERWASSPSWLAAFADRYIRQVGLPIRTTLYAPDVTGEAAALLARTRCEEVTVPIGSATALIRNDILGLNLTTEAAEAALAALRRAGIRSVARVEIGAPYETAASLEHTVHFLRRLDPDRVDAVLHYPIPGTHAHKVAQENGWLVPDAAAAHLAGKPAVVLPAISTDDVITACESLPYAVHRPRIVPLIRLGRRVRIGRHGTLYDLVVKPFLAPPMRRAK